MSIRFKFSSLHEGSTTGNVKIIIHRVLTCAFCRGVGKIGGGTCAVCGGKKKNKVSPPTIVCRRCAGWGSYPMNSQSFCMACRGRGVVSVTLPIDNCPQCNGKGDNTNGLSCATCHGTGIIRGSHKKGKKESSNTVYDTVINVKKLGE